MTTTVQSATGNVGARLDRYRHAESQLWADYGLRPVEHFVDLTEPQVRLRIVEVGSGPPVLFIPGIGGTGPYWAPLVAQLGGFRSFLVDRPGWGLSDPIDYRDRDFGRTTAAILGGLLNSFGIERVDLVGASIGGLWALRFAQYVPARVGRVVLLGGGPLVDELPIPRFIRLIASPVGAVVTRLPVSAKTMRSQLAAIGHGPSVQAGRMDSFIDWRVALMRETASMRHERSMIRALLDRGAWRNGFIPSEADLASVTAPVRMFVGSADSTGTVDTWRRFISRFPDGRLDVIDGAGHMPWWDEPATVGGATRTFLEQS